NSRVTLGLQSRDSGNAPKEKPSYGRHVTAIELADDPRGVRRPLCHARKPPFTPMGKNMSNRSWPRRLVLTAVLATISATVGAANTHDNIFTLPDHFEFDATIAAAYQADSR